MSREKAIAALYGAVVDDRGRWWGEIATDRQREDAEALLDPTGSRFHFQTRPRGGSKTTDLAPVLAVSLIFLSKPSDRAFAFAFDRDQARLLYDALAGIARRTAAFSALEVGFYSVTAPSGAP
jgi:hypothetical protein